MNKNINKYWNEITGFVFKSIDERYVIGRLDNGIIVPLTEQDKEVAIKFNFDLPKY